MPQEKKGILQPSEGLSRREGAKRPLYTELVVGDVLIGRSRAYLVVRREGEGITYLPLTGDHRALVVLPRVQDLPIAPDWELIRAV